MCHLLISSKTCTVFIKSFLTTPALTNLKPSLLIISVATLFGVLTVATWPVKQFTYIISLVPLNMSVRSVSQFSFCK